VRLLAAVAALCLSVAQIVTAQAPRRDLAIDERNGGHTLARHVGRTDAQLTARLRDQPGISAASTYPDRETAETVVGATLERERGRVAGWSRRSGGRANLALRYRGDPRSPIGRSLRRGRPRSEPCPDAVVVLRWDVRRDAFLVLTSYPDVRQGGGR
jgi:hypothetical protein